MKKHPNIGIIAGSYWHYLLLSLTEEAMKDKKTSHMMKSNYQNILEILKKDMDKHEDKGPADIEDPNIQGFGR